MNWGDEPWVKLYTRLTASMYKLSERGRGMWHMMIRICDRAGVIDYGGEVSILAHMLMLSDDIGVQDQLEKMEASGMIQCDGTMLVLSNFIEAQSASSSDKARQRKLRETRRDAVKLMSQNVTDTSQDVTNASRDAEKPSRRVTTRIEETRLEEKRDRGGAKEPESRGKWGSNKNADRSQEELDLGQGIGEVVNVADKADSVGRIECQDVAKQSLQHSNLSEGENVHDQIEKAMGKKWWPGLSAAKKKHILRDSEKVGALFERWKEERTSLAEDISEEIGERLTAGVRDIDKATVEALGLALASYEIGDISKAVGCVAMEVRERLDDFKKSTGKSRIFLRDQLKRDFKYFTLITISRGDVEQRAQRYAELEEEEHG